MRRSAKSMLGRMIDTEPRYVWPLRSIVLLLVCAVSATAQQPTPTPRPGRAYSSDELPKAPPPAGPKGQSPVTFTDITALSKVDFKHAGSPSSQKYLLDTMGGSVAIFDYDNDGQMDLFVTKRTLLRDPMPKGAIADKSDSRFLNCRYLPK